MHKHLFLYLLCLMMSQFLHAADWQSVSDNESKQSQSTTSIPSCWLENAFIPYQLCHSTAYKTAHTLEDISCVGQPSDSTQLRFKDFSHTLRDLIDQYIERDTNVPIQPPTIFFASGNAGPSKLYIYSKSKDAGHVALWDLNNLSSINSLLIPQEAQVYSSGLVIVKTGVQTQVAKLSAQGDILSSGFTSYTFPPTQNSDECLRFSADPAPIAHLINDKIITIKNMRAGFRLDCLLTDIMIGLPTDSLSSSHQPKKIMLTRGRAAPPTFGAPGEIAFIENGNPLESYSLGRKVCFIKPHHNLPDQTYTLPSSHYHIFNIACSCKGAGRLILLLSGLSSNEPDEDVSVFETPLFEAPFSQKIGLYTRNEDHLIRPEWDLRLPDKTPFLLPDNVDPRETIYLLSPQGVHRLESPPSSTRSSQTAASLTCVATFPLQNHNSSATRTFIRCTNMIYSLQRITDKYTFTFSNFLVDWGKKTAVVNVQVQYNNTLTYDMEQSGIIILPLTSSHNSSVRFLPYTTLSAFMSEQETKNRLEQLHRQQYSFKSHPHAVAPYLSPYTLRTAHNQQQPKTLVPLPPHSLIVKHYASPRATLICTAAVGLCAIMVYRHRCSTNTNK